MEVIFFFLLRGRSGVTAISKGDAIFRRRQNTKWVVPQLAMAKESPPRQSEIFSSKKLPFPS